MSVKIVEAVLSGVMLIEPTVYKDERGYFFESYNQAEYASVGIINQFVQDNQSKSSYGVIRGLHSQANECAQAKLMRVLHGAILDVVVDIREGSPTFGQHVSFELSSENNHQLFIPRGFLHGFSTLSETAIIAYKCDNPYHKAAESGVRFDDSALRVNWRIPANDVSISDKDGNLGSFSDVARYRG